jgi:ribosomal protein L12E/L44/L45/RPP1/RPP2
MKKTIAALSGIAMTLALAGASFAAQTTPAPAAKTASSTASKSDKKVVKKHSKAKTTKKSASAVPAK